MSSNGRELKAVLLSVKAASAQLSGTRVLVETDNKTTMAYINHMGGRSRFLHSMARELWLHCHKHSIWLQAVHRPGKVTAGSAQARQGKHQGRSTVPMEKGSHRCLTPPSFFSAGGAAVRSPLSGPFCYQGQQASAKVCLLEAGSRIGPGPSLARGGTGGRCNQLIEDRLAA